MVDWIWFGHDRACEEGGRGRGGKVRSVAFLKHLAPRNVDCPSSLDPREIGCTWLQIVPLACLLHQLVCESGEFISTPRRPSRELLPRTVVYSIRAVRCCSVKTERTSKCAQPPGRYVRTSVRAQIVTIAMALTAANQNPTSPSTSQAIESKGSP
jgi:hypothetical protein